MKKHESSYTSLEEPFEAEQIKELGNANNSKRRRRKKTWFDYVLTLLIVALFGAGLFLLFRPTIVRWNRAKLANELQVAVDKNETVQIAYDPNANRIQAAEYDYFEVDAAGNMVGASAPTNTEATTISQGLQYMTPIGRLEIPLLKVNIPLIKELDYYAMYYAASHWDQTPMPDQAGNSAIFIHRDSYDDYDFTHAEQLQVNDPIYVTYNGERHRYSIINFSTIWPTETMNDLLTKYQSPTEHYITLVTCTPAAGMGVEPFTHRLLITAILNDEKPVETANAANNSATSRIR